MSGPQPAELLFRSARQRLTDAGLPTPDLDASLLLEHATGITVLVRMTEPGRLVPVGKVETFEECVGRRLVREPVHRIIGWREFYGIPLKLSDATLVPRPDTETLVDLVIPFVEDRVARKGRCRILDIGTGSGAIALALLASVKGTIATGSDISEDALRIAAQNAAELGLGERFTPVLSNWFDSLGGRFDLIVSNPPYIRSGEIKALETDVRDHDPLTALDGGDDGLNAYGVIAARAASLLSPKGALAVEIGHDQNHDVTNLFAVAGYRMAETRKDYSGRDRAIFFVK